MSEMMEVEGGEDTEEEDNDVCAFLRASRKGSLGSELESLERRLRAKGCQRLICQRRFGPSDPRRSPIQSFTSLSSSRYKRREGTST